MAAFPSLAMFGFGRPRGAGGTLTKEQFRQTLLDFFNKNTPVTAPGPTAPASILPPTPPDTTAAASTATAAATVAAQRQKKRATGFNLPGQRLATSAPLASPALQPKSLLGY